MDSRLRGSDDGDGTMNVDRPRLTETVAPPRAGAARGSCPVLQPGDPNLRWDDVWFERNGHGHGAAAVA